MLRVISISIKVNVQTQLNLGGVLLRQFHFFRGIICAN